MKKKTALVLTLAMVFSLAPLSAYAETITTGGGAASHDVTATYRADSSGGAGGTVYNVDITWGDMAFTYTAEAGIWDPTTHKTTDAEGGVWTVNNDGGNIIKVTNTPTRASRQRSAMRQTLALRASPAALTMHSSICEPPSARLWTRPPTAQPHFLLAAHWAAPPPTTPKSAPSP